jgi:GNAT superfamily N-acetyltransferase
LRPRSLIAPLIVLIAALYLLPAQLAPRRFPTDDSFFYLQVARNIVAGHGSTFNTVTPTNGYHPLWMGVCVVAEAVARGDRDLVLRIVFAIQAALAAGALLLFRSAARSLGISSWLVSVPILAAYFLTGQYGSEAHINGLMLILAIVRLIRQVQAPSRRNEILLGIALGLAFLARLDNLFFVVAATATAAWAASAAPRATATAATARATATAEPQSASPRSRLVALAWIATPALALALPYLIWNRLEFGHFVPISGAIKSTFPELRPDLRNLGTLGFITFVTALAGAAALTLPRTPRLRRLVLGPLATGVIAHALYVVVYTDHNTHWSWYYVAGVILLAFLAAIAADALTQRLPRRLATVATVLAIVAITTWGIARGWARHANADAASHNQLVIQFLPPTPYDRWTVQFARWMEAHLPPHAGILVFDYPGALAYYTTLRIVPADGLMSDFQTDVDLRREGLGRWLAERRIDYYLGPNPSGATPCDSAIIWAPLSRKPVGAVVRCTDDRIITSAEATQGVQEPDVALHRIRRVVPVANAPREHTTKHGALW